MNKGVRKILNSLKKVRNVCEFDHEGYGVLFEDALLMKYKFINLDFSIKKIVFLLVSRSISKG
jgi:hypothetical protein